MKYYLAIDLGASSGRHILAHLDGNRLITEEIHRFSNEAKIVEKNGKRTLLWDTEHLFSEILNGLKKAKEIGKIPVSVGVDTWGVDYVLLDEKDAPVQDVYAYRDARTEETVPLVHAIESKSSLFARTGIQFNTFNTVYQLYADLLSGSLKKAKSFLTLPDYFHFRLTGVKKQEYTDATTTGLVNAKTHAWDYDLLEKLGFPKELFGPLSAPGTLVGSFTKEVEAFVGYNAVVRLPATHDTASAVLAAPLEGRTPYISSGTWSLLGVEQLAAHTESEAMKSGYSNEGSVNGEFRLQKNIMGLWMIQQVRREIGEKYDFATLAKMAAENPVKEEISVNDQRFLAPSSMKEEIESAVGKKLSVGETAFVIFDNLAKSYAESLDALEKLTGERYETLNIIGGGSQNSFLNELTKKYAKRRVIAGPAEGTAIGNLLMQMVGSGDISSIAEGRKIVKNSFDVNEIK